MSTISRRKVRPLRIAATVAAMAVRWWDSLRRTFLGASIAARLRWSVKTAVVYEVALRFRRKLQSEKLASRGRTGLGLARAGSLRRVRSQQGR